jgi:hypothetical protein
MAYNNMHLHTEQYFEMIFMMQMYFGLHFYQELKTFKKLKIISQRLHMTIEKG